MHLQSIKNTGISLVVILLLFAGTGRMTAQRTPANYCNERYGFCIQYNPALLVPGPVAGNGDGRRFSDRKGHERLSVYGTGDWTFDADGNPVSLTELYHMELKGGRFPEPGAHRAVTYKALGKTSFVLSGTEKGAVFYLKVVKRADIFCYAWLHYPSAEAAQYSPVAELIAKSFR